MRRFFKGQEGNVAAPLLVIIGGISMMLAQSEFSSLNNRLDQVRSESRKSFLAQQNSSSLQMAARLLVSEASNAAAPLHLDPYISTSPCGPDQKFADSTQSDWTSSADAITIFSPSQDQLKTNSENIFTQLSRGIKPSISADSNSHLKVLGWKCNEVHPFLIEGVYVEAEGTSVGTQGQASKVSKTNAFLAMSAPPASGCLFYAKDAAGNFFPADKKPVGNPSLNTPETSADVYLECNNVITDAKIYNNGVQIAGTGSYPRTSADRIDANYQVLLGPIAIAPGANTLQAFAEQVDGTMVIMEFVMTVTTPVSVEICAYQCDSVSPVYTCETSYMAHRNWYNGFRPGFYVCYQCSNFYGFDPNNGCQNVGVVGVRGGMGCFAEDTQILLENGRKVPIKDLRAGDRIWNPILKKAVTVSKIVEGNESQALFRVTQGSKTVRVTEGHPFFTQLGLLSAKELKAGDWIQSQEGGWSKVDSVVKETQGYGKHVWNLELDADPSSEAGHMVVANGIITGDLYLQKRVSSRHLLESLTIDQPNEEEP